MQNILARNLYVIAECAQGYAASTTEESINLALWLTRCSKAAGADAVKFQYVIADEICCPDYKYYNLFKSLELGENGWRRVVGVASEIGIEVLFDIFGPSSLEQVVSIGVSGIKIHPTDFTNTELLLMASGTPELKHIALGCGGASHCEIEYTLSLFNEHQTISLIHGFQGYPTPRVDNCLKRLMFFQKYIKTSRAGLRLGFADHADPGSFDATHLAAIALGHGVTVIEKHLTLARCLELEDHEAALSPDEFMSFVNILRAMQEANTSDFTDDEPFILPDSELAYRRMVSRQVVSKRNLSKGTVIAQSDVCLKRSTDTSAFSSLSSVVGRKLGQNIIQDTPITQTMISQ